jgi:predicted aconitase
MSISVEITIGSHSCNGQHPAGGPGAARRHHREVPLRELSAATVRSALKDLAATRATRTVAMTHAGLTRAIRHAEANDKVRRNVAMLVDAPAGQEGRPSSRSHSGKPL